MFMNICEVGKLLVLGKNQMEVERQQVWNDRSSIFPSKMNIESRVESKFDWRVGSNIPRGLTEL